MCFKGIRVQGASGGLYRGFRAVEASGFGVVERVDRVDRAERRTCVRSFKML